MEKFKSKWLIKVEWLCDSMTRRFKFEVDAKWVAIFQLYCQVETRGFYVVTPKKVLTSKGDICLSSGLLDAYTGFNLL